MTPSNFELKPVKSLYNIDLNAADGSNNFLNQFKGKVTMVVNTTVGCGNANQMEVLQWLQDYFNNDDFEIIAIPTNDYCGPGITHGKWSQGITCGSDSEAYAKDTYGATFKFSEMIASNPNEHVSEIPGKNGLGQEHKEPHNLYKEIENQMASLYEVHRRTCGKARYVPGSDKYYSWWLNQGFDGGIKMSGNFEKYLVDRDGYVAKHIAASVLNYDHEKTVAESHADNYEPLVLPQGRSSKIFDEEFEVVKGFIKELIDGQMSDINPKISILNNDLTVDAFGNNKESVLV